MKRGSANVLIAASRPGLVGGGGEDEGGAGEQGAEGACACPPNLVFCLMMFSICI